MTPLRKARDEMGWTKVKLVTLIENYARAHGIKLNKTRASLMREVSFWESGSRSPQEPILGILCALYGRTAHELGLNPTPDQARSNIGLVYSPALHEAVDTLSKLSTFDITRHTSVINGAYSIDAINAACLDWLYRPTSNGERGGRITSADVAEVKAAAQMFDSLDRTVGGETQRLLAVQFVREKLAPKLSRASDDANSRALFTAAATLCEVIGWMAYDSERHSIAQRYFVQALRLSKDADEPTYGAFVLNTMAHQALYLNRPEQALRCALAALGNTHINSAPIVGTEAALLAARAHARMRNEHDGVAELRRAESLFERVTDTNTPKWAAHWSEAVFSTYAGTMWVDLGKPREAYGPLKLAWDAASDQPRRRVYSTGQLAKVAVLNRDIEQAATLGLEAAVSTSRQESKRSLQVIRDLDRQLKPHAKQPKVREFRERARLLLAG